MTATQAPPRERSERRATAIGLVVWAATVGAVIGPNLVGISGDIAASAGLPRLAGPYLVPLVLVAIAASLSVLLLRPDPRDLADQLLAVLREALSNIARHAEAQAAMVEVDVADDRLVLRVVDNGKGLPAERHESGLRNVRRRASEHGGTVDMGPEEPSGTRLEWSVPLRG